MNVMLRCSRAHAPHAYHFQYLSECQALNISAIMTLCTGMWRLQLRVHDPKLISHREIACIITSMRQGCLHSALPCLQPCGLLVSPTHHKTGKWHVDWTQPAHPTSQSGRRAAGAKEVHTSVLPLAVFVYTSIGYHTIPVGISLVSGHTFWY